jgi:hypothetical protein
MTLPHLHIFFGLPACPIVQQGARELATLAGRALDPEAPAVQIDQFPRDREPQSGANKTRFWAPVALADTL